MSLTTKEHWNNAARVILKAELSRDRMTYSDLAERMTANGMRETKHTVGNKLKEGTFSASFFLAALKAIGRKSINLDDI